MNLCHCIFVSCPVRVCSTHLTLTLLSYPYQSSQFSQLVQFKMDSKGVIIRLTTYFSVKKLYFSKVIFLKQIYQHGPKWVQVVQNVPKQFKMFKIIKNGQKLSKMVESCLNRLQWSKVVLYGLIWFKRVQNGPNLSNMVQKSKKWFNKV